MAKYAITMTSVGMLTGVNAFYNGLKHYGNEVDFYLIGGEPEREYAKKAGINFTDINEMGKGLPDDKRGGWRVRFLRYKKAEEIADDYDAVMIVDADMLCVNNLMPFFKIAADTGYIVMPNNSWGASRERIKEVGIDMLKGASSPPFHSLTILDPKKHKKLLRDVWKWGLKEPYGDMVTINRCIFRNGLEDQVYELPNHEWILSTFYLDTIKPRGDKLVICEEEIKTIHRRWWMTGVCEKFVNDIKEPEIVPIGKNNVKIFFNTFKKFNTEIGIKLPFDYANPKI